MIEQELTDFCSKKIEYGINSYLAIDGYDIQEASSGSKNSVTEAHIKALGLKCIGMCPARQSFAYLVIQWLSIRHIGFGYALNNRFEKLSDLHHGRVWLHYLTREMQSDIFICIIQYTDIIILLQESIQETVLI